MPKTKAVFVLLKISDHSMKIIIVNMCLVQPNDIVIVNTHL